MDLVAVPFKFSHGGGSCERSWYEELVVSKKSHDDTLVPFLCRTNAYAHVWFVVVLLLVNCPRAPAPHCPCRRKGGCVPCSGWSVD